MNNNASELIVLKTIAYVSQSLPVGYRFLILTLIIALIGFCRLVPQLPNILHEIPPVIRAIKEPASKATYQVDSVKSKTFIARGYIVASVKPAQGEAQIIIPCSDDR